MARHLTLETYYGTFWKSLFHVAAAKQIKISLFHVQLKFCIWQRLVYEKFIVGFVGNLGSLSAAIALSA